MRWTWPTLSWAGNEFGNDGAVGLLEVVEQVLHVLPAEDFVAVALDGLGKMGDEDGGGIHDGVAADLGVFAFGVGDPGGGELEDRLDGGQALENGLAVGGVHGEPMAGHQLALDDGIALEEKAVLIGFQLQIVAEADGRDDDAHFLGEGLADAGDPFEQVAALARVGQADQAEAQFDLQGVHGEEILQFVGRAGGGGGPGRRSAGGFGAGVAGLEERFLALQLLGEHARQRGEGQERQAAAAPARWQRWPASPTKWPALWGRRAIGGSVPCPVPPWWRRG